MSKIPKIILLLLLCFFYNKNFALNIKLDKYIFSNIESNINIKLNKFEKDSIRDELVIENLTSGKKETLKILFKKGECNVNYIFPTSGNYSFKILNKNKTINKYITIIPLWLSILPPLLAILMALIVKEVISSLFFGVLLGSTILHVYSYGIKGFLSGFFSVIDTYVINSLNNWGHLAVIIFSMLIGAMVSIITKNGGMQGVVNFISKKANNPVTAQLATWFLGIAIFFDDYANTLVVGNTMRSVTDKLKISREKLSYIVDATAAPVAAIAFITTWIGAELGYIADGIKNIGINENPYNIFINSLAYSFYPVLTIIFIFLLIIKKRDFGPMFKAEKRAREKGIVISELDYHKKTFTEKEYEAESNLHIFEAKKGIKYRAINAILPVATIITVTIAGLIITGWDTKIIYNNSISFIHKLSLIIGNSNSYLALTWASLSGVVVAVLMSIGQRILSLADSIEFLTQGFKTMLPAIMILVFAWSLARITEDMHTADFLTLTIRKIGVIPVLIPFITFILAALVSFSTGSSWGTMAILYPLMLPAAWKISSDAGLNYNETLSIFHNVVSCVLAGSVLGDHCSPISDTTILSSLASSCNHIDHVRTQLPYALTVGLVSLFFGTLLSALGLNNVISLFFSIIVLFLIVHFIGKKVPVVNV